MGNNDTGAAVASPIGSSVGAKAPTGKGAAKKTTAGIKVKNDDIELAWENLMQGKLASLAGKMVVAGKKKGKEVQPSADVGAAEVGGEDANEEEGEELNGEEEDEDEEWAHEVELELMERAAIRRPRPRSPWRFPTERTEPAVLAAERSTARWTCVD
jgi:hypothetical protein